MKVIAYLYQGPTTASTPKPPIWGCEVDQYQDFDGRRPQLQELLCQCQVQPVNYLLLRRLEELGNSVQEVSDRLTQLETLGVHVIATEQDYNSFSSEDTAANSQNSSDAKVLKLLAEIQFDQRRRRIQEGHTRNRLKALPPPGKAPYGYRRGKDRYAIDRSAVPVVKDFFEQFLLYGSLRGAVRYLEKKHGKKISVSTGRRWLSSPVYRGDLVYQNQQVLPGTHVPIVSREEAAQIDRLLRRNRSLAPRAASAPRSLAGLVVCGACQSPMTVTRTTAVRSPQEYLYLRPVACPQTPKCRSIHYQQVLEQTIERVCQDLPQAVAGLDMPAMDQIKDSIEAAIAAKQQAINELPPLVTREILDPATAELRAYKLRTEISELKGKLAQLPPVNLQKIAQAVSIPQFWFDLSEAERRFYFREFIRQIEIVRQDSEWSLKLIFIF
jgi:DNA invertase Pin-like site-specific DNA recombinase